MTCILDIKSYYKAAEIERGGTGAKIEKWMEYIHRAFQTMKALLFNKQL